MAHLLMSAYLHDSEDLKVVAVEKIKENRGFVTMDESLYLLVYIFRNFEGRGEVGGGSPKSGFKLNEPSLKYLTCNPAGSNIPDLRECIHAVERKGSLVTVVSIQ